ncbi:hypothetical protein Sjap_013545 [Stephania japonica]|uniref:Uncharacterized protein n=1 Tax=Stephania japonica TaxID=461633 RepID=A0AAP0IYA2_9MAGN
MMLHPQTLTDSAATNTSSSINQGRNSREDRKKLMRRLEEELETLDNSKSQTLIHQTQRKVNV